MDTNEDRLGFATTAVKRIVEQAKCPAKVVSATDRPTVLEGADAVLCTILVGGVSVWRHDIEIPKKYGVDINVGDTRGPAGIFRALRTIPVMVDIVRDIEKYCPRALFLNYTNPMAMIMRAVQTVSSVQSVGLCHSVQGTAEMLARWIGAPMEEITYLSAGINHQAWYLQFRWKGEDAYPLIRKAIERPEIFDEEQVRNEMFRHLDYYVTESSGHNSEYVAWFRKRPDLIERYCTHGTGWNPGKYAYILREYLATEQTWMQETKKWLAKNEPVDLHPSNEYAAFILNAVLGDGTLFEFNGNLRNDGLIDNLPSGACVEVPILASKLGLKAVHVGSLPAQLSLLNNISSMCEELAVEACLEGDRRKVFHAIAFDPLTSAVLSLSEIDEMVNELFTANRNDLPQFQALRR